MSESERVLVWLAGGGHHPGLPQGFFLGSPGSVAAWRYPDGHLELADLSGEPSAVPVAEAAQPEAVESEQTQPEVEPEPAADPALVIEPAAEPEAPAEPLADKE